MSSTNPPRIPKYRLYRPKNLAVVRLDGRDIYLGAYNSPESRAKYDRLIAEWLANGRRLPQTVAPVVVKASILVSQVLDAFEAYAKTYYVKEGETTNEVSCFKYAIDPVRQLYGDTPAEKFGPLALKVVREQFIQRDICRSHINSRINRIKRIFKWAVSEELVPPAVFEGLRTVAGLRYGRSTARESEPVRPVAMEHVEAILPFISPHVSAMIQLQVLTGMRPGEVIIMRPQDVDRTGETWIYQPSTHKTKYRGMERVVPLGPKAQALLQPFLNRDPAAFLFSAKEAEQWRNEQRAVERNPHRKTKIYPCELKARERRKQQAKRRQAKRPKRDRFDVASYRRAITYGIEKAERAGLVVPHWHPHQLRHTFATETRRMYGVEAAQVALGHARADVTQVYAERNLELAMKLAREVG